MDTLLGIGRCNDQVDSPYNLSSVVLGLSANDFSVWRVDVIANRREVVVEG